MNWEMTKNWLIGIFLVLDLILGWQLEQSRQALRDYVESYSDLLANTKTLLADRGFTLATDVPSDQPDLSAFEATYSALPPAEVWHIAFPHAKSVKAEGNAIVTNEGQIRVVGIGTWEVAYNLPIAVSANDLLTYVWHGADYEPDVIASSPGDTAFDEMYKTYPIFDARVDFDYDSGTTSGYTQTHLAQFTTTGQPKPIISALDALVSLANSIDKSGNPADNRILNIDLGYAQKIVLDSSTASTLTHYWFPVWRVSTSQQVYYINAFTGEVNTAP